MINIKESIKEISSFFNLSIDKEDDQRVIAQIKENIAFKGINTWFLILAIFIASVGLNINSTAVIIGAMLISPLMGPIIGMGLGLGTNDFSTLTKSSFNLFVAVVVSIIISTIYFYLSPMDIAQSELLGRTSPTIYDVMIAVFGGLVGILTISRKEKNNNVLAGVSIATALMPPLCTVGFGIATLQVNFIFGALYLFIINCTFICISAFIGVKIINLPNINDISTHHKARVNRLMLFLVLFISIPATYFAYIFIDEIKFKNNSEKFIQENFLKKDFVIIYKNINYNVSPHTIELAFLSSQFTDSEIVDLQKKLKDFKLDNTRLIVRQNELQLNKQELLSAIAELKNENEKVKAMESNLQNVQFLQNNPEQVLSELKVINNKVVDLAIGGLTYASSSKYQTVVIFSDKKKYPISLQEKNIITDWLKLRLSEDNIRVVTNLSDS